MVAINALDDPFIDEISLPTYDDVGSIAPVRLIYYPHGGHCGFIANKESYKIPGQENDQVFVPSYGWLADEMGRALCHIHTPADVPEHTSFALSQTMGPQITFTGMKPQFYSILSLSPLIFFLSIKSFLEDLI